MWEVTWSAARLLAHAQTRPEAVGEVDWDVVVDATIVRAAGTRRGAEGGRPSLVLQCVTGMNRQTGPGVTGAGGIPSRQVDPEG